MSIILISLLGAWIVSLPYEGQLLYIIAKNYSMESETILDISLAMQVFGLILGGVIVRKIETAKKVLIIALPVSILCSVTFLFPSYMVWTITLTVCAAIAGICITSTGYFIKNSILPENRFRTVAEILIIINVIKLIISVMTLYASTQAGVAFTVLVLAAAWYLVSKIDYSHGNTITAREFDKKTGYKALFLLFLFIAIIAVDFGIMTQTVNPKYDSFGWLTSWYWILPYAGTALIIRRMKNTDNRSGMLYISIGLLGFGYILFMLLDYTIGSYLIVNTIMMSAWAIYDIFWWSILAEMLDMAKNSAKILSIGFSAIMIGVLAGKLITDNLMDSSLSILVLAAMFIILFILPVLHRFLSIMIKRSDFAADYDEKKILNLPADAASFSDREKEIAVLLLKGRTCKLIAADLGLSENTVKTHIKNVYAKLRVKKKSEFFNLLIK